MTARTWEINDRIAERADGAWHLGTVVGVDGPMLAIRFDGGDRATFRDRRSPFLHDPDDVPIDERTWVPESVRDQLVRQEAAGRLQAMAEHLPYGGGLHALADRIAESVDVGESSGFESWRAGAARALLAPAPQRATTPTTEGAPA